jgi:hypothetical protein
MHPSIHPPVCAVLQEHAPSLLADDPGVVDRMLLEYQGREVALLRKLRDEYDPKELRVNTAPLAVAAAVPVAAGQQQQGSQPTQALKHSASTATMSVGSPEGSVNEEEDNDFDSDFSDDDVAGDGEVDKLLLDQFMQRLRSTLASEYVCHTAPQCVCVCECVRGWVGGWVTGWMTRWVGEEVGWCDWDGNAAARKRPKCVVSSGARVYR